MIFRIPTLGLICLAICSTQSAYSQTPRNAQHWTAYSRTASDITGDITLSSTRIVFENGVSLRLSYVGESRKINMNSYGLTGPVHIFRISDARAVTLLNGNTLCGPMTRPIPATFIGTVSIGAKELGIAVFSGKGNLTGLNLESRLCGTYSYLAN